MTQMSLFDQPPAEESSEAQRPVVHTLPFLVQNDRPEIIPFGRMQGKSVEQVALQDFNYFHWLRGRKIKKGSLRQRVDVVYFVLNTFVSQVSCTCCDNPAEHVSLVHTPNMGRSGSSSMIYCSPRCYEEDTQANHHRAVLTPLTADAMLSNNKSETKQLMKIIADCMGLRESRRTKEYLNEAVNSMTLRIPYR